MYKIAVIEDDTLLGQALVEMLTSHGYQAFAAESVTKARRLVGETAGGSAFDRPRACGWRRRGTVPAKEWAGEIAGDFSDSER